MRSLISILHVLVIYSILRAVISQASTCDLKKVDRWLYTKENQVYLGKTEKKRVIYRGISTDLGNALDLAFKDVKKGICPEIKKGGVL